MFAFFRQNSAAHLDRDEAEVRLRSLPTTPAYVYDLSAITTRARQLRAALGDRGHAAYAIKANPSPTIARALIGEGIGIDVVSGGELKLALACGAHPDDIVFSGVGKTQAEIDLAIGTSIGAIHAESVEELTMIGDRARTQNRRPRVGLRINPSVLADTHAHIATGHDDAKFGIAQADFDRALDSILRAPCELVGLSCHVGSNLQSIQPYLDGLDKLCDLAGLAQSRGFVLKYIDAGGGMGIDYTGTAPPPPVGDFVRAARKKLDDRGFGEQQLCCEPGRVLVAEFCALVGRVVRTKVSGARRWCVIDCGMNDLIRPALYQALHRISAVRRSRDLEAFRVVGPICESSDDFGMHELPSDIAANDFIVIADAGAYGRSMASTYNMRSIAGEAYFEGSNLVRWVAPQTDDQLIEQLIESHGRHL